MKTEYIDVDGKWGIVIVMDFDTEYEEYDLSAIMSSFGMRKRSISKALSVLSTLNSGMAVSRDDIQMSCVFISPTSSYSQFWNTVSHEMNHVATAIIDYYGEPYDSEGAAYLHGYLLQRVVEEIATPCI